jgi:ELWxxDGT repeat protein
MSKLLKTIALFILSLILISCSINELINSEENEDKDTSPGGTAIVDTPILSTPELHLNKLDILDSQSTRTTSEYIIYNNKKYITAHGKLYLYENDAKSIIEEGLEVSDIKSLIVFQDKLYFVASSTTTGYELFLYNGSEIELALDIYTGTTSSRPSNLIIYEDKLYFSANSGTEGYELFSYDGNTVSTISDLDTGIQSLTVHNNRLYFSASTNGIYSRLYYYDGNNVNLHNSNLKYIRKLAATNNKLYALSSKNAGVDFVFSEINDSDFNILAEDTSYSNFITYKDKIYLFEYFLDTSDPEIYRGSLNMYSYDESQGFNKLDGIQLTHASDFTLFDSSIYFIAELHGEEIGREIYKFDGTSIELVSDINEGENDSSPRNLTVLDDELYFSAFDGENREVYKISIY